jgi:hypothetical protein
MRSSSNFFRFVGAAFLTLFVAMLLARTALLAIESRTANTNLFMRHRLREMTAALPRIAALPGPMALIFGASEMEVGFQPDVFDEAMNKKGEPITSFNLAVRNGVPVFSYLIEQVKAAGVRPDLAIVKFSPAFLTTAAREHWALSDDVLSSVLSLRDLLREPFDRAIALFADRYFFDGMSPVMARYYLADWFDSTRRFKWSRNSPLVFRNRDLNQEPAWDFAARGFFYFGLPKTKTALDSVLREYQAPDVQQAVFDYHKRCCDIEGLHFDVGLVRDFIVNVRELKSLSKRVVLLYFPDRVSRNADETQRLLQIMETVAKQSGVEWLNVEAHFSAEDFIDPVHLTFDASKRLSKRIAEQLPP